MSCSPGLRRGGFAHCARRERVVEPPGEGEDLEAENFSDANVRVRLETEHDEKYGDKNRVKSYLAPSKAKRQVAPPPPPSDVDVPF